MLVSGWVLLGLEQRVKVPKGALDEVVCWHLCEAAVRISPEFFFSVFKKQERFLLSVSNGNSPHFQEDLPELRSHLHQWVQVATVRCNAQGVKVVWLKNFFFPASTEIISTELISKEATLPQRLQFIID